MLRRLHSVVDSSSRNLCVRIQRMKTLEEVYVMADAHGVELIPDTESNLWCYRPVILDDEGVETVRYAPDPYEFKYSFDQIKHLIDMIAERPSL